MLDFTSISMAVARHKTAFVKTVTSCSQQLTIGKEHELILLLTPAWNEITHFKIF